jgi:quercetin dioxygenase-like cupin family protein
MIKGYRLRMSAVAVLSCGVILAAPTAPAAKASTDRVVLSRPLPAMKGDNLKITVLEVTYAPGTASPAHSHPCPVVAYVESGAIRSQVQGEPEAVFGVGGELFRTG